LDQRGNAKKALRAANALQTGYGRKVPRGREAGLYVDGQREWTKPEPGIARVVFLRKGN